MLAAIGDQPLLDLEQREVRAAPNQAQKNFWIGQTSVVFAVQAGLVSPWKPTQAGNGTQAPEEPGAPSLR
jgi:hypothetical protein